MNENNQIKAFLTFLIIISVMMLSQAAGAAVVVKPVLKRFSTGPTGNYYNSVESVFNASMMAYTEVPATVNLGSKSIPLAAKLPLATNAAAVAKNAMRLNPWALAGTLALPWLLEQGMEWSDAEQQWRKFAPSQYTQVGSYYGYPSFREDGDGSCNTASSGTDWCTPGDGFVNTAVGDEGSCAYWCLMPGTVPATESNPASDADWDALPSPFPAIGPEAANAPYMPEGAPVGTPVFDSGTVNIGPPYTKPDGSTVQPKTTVTDNGDGTVTLDTYDEPVTDTQGNPVPYPVPQDTIEDQQTDCDKYPNIIGCSQYGQTPAAEPLNTLEVPVSPTVTPVGGAGSCPADITTSIYGLTWSYQPICDFASAIRPLIIGFAWLAFAYIVAGTVRT